MSYGMFVDGPGTAAGHFVVVYYWHKSNCTLDHLHALRGLGLGWGGGGGGGGVWGAYVGMHEGALGACG